MQIVFLITAVIGSCYFLLAKRIFDFFSVAFFSSIIYFMPGFFGYVQFPVPNSPILDETYLIMTLILIAILLGAIFFDVIKLPKRLKVNLLENNEYILFSVACLVVICLVGSFLTQGSALFALTKTAIISHPLHWLVFWKDFTLFGGVLAFIKKKWAYFIFFLLFIVFDIYIGYRSIAAILFISIVTISLYNQGKQRLLFTNCRNIFLILIGGAFFFIYKSVYMQIKAGNWQNILQRLHNIKFYYESFSHSEPFVTQAILNEVIRHNFHTGLDSLLGIMRNFYIFGNLLHTNYYSFNNLFQQKLFPLVKFGMANNIWAEMFSIYGFFSLLLFIFIFILFVSIFSYLLRTKNYNFLAMILMLGNYWSFYIHRNDIIYQLVLERRVLFVWIIALFFAALFSNVIQCIISIKNE